MRRAEALAETATHTTTKTTPAQQRRVQEVRAANGGARVYTYTTKGQTVLDQFRRYVTRQDADCIGRALYEFLTVACNFIAETGLVPPDGSFRLVWAEPADLIDSLPGETAYMPARGGRVGSVYADGMTDVEVLEGIDRLAAEHHTVCALARSDRQFDREISAMIQIAEAHQFTVLPPGWKVADLAEEHPATHAEPTGSLAEALARLANRNGLALIAPPPVDADGQVRLL
jgi:hypothetical protein